MSADRPPENTRADINRRYYENHKEQIKQRARENYARKTKDKIKAKPGRKPGSVGSYKQKWIEEGQKIAAQAPQEQPAAEEIN